MSDPVTLFFGQRRGERFELAPEDTHHAVRVMRHRAGDTVWCIDGSGTLFGVELERTGARTARGRIVSEQRDFNERSGDVTLICGMTLVSRLDWLVEKGPRTGLFLGASSSITPGTPLANIKALCEGLAHYRSHSTAHK